MPAESQQVLSRLDQLIDTQGMLRHPFYQAWTRGDLSRHVLREYASQYYHHVAAFPTYLSAVHSRTEDQSVRRHLLSNLMDEEAGSPNHPELWLQFADSLGASPARPVWPETQALIDTFRAACSSDDPAVGVAALYAYESQIPAVAETKANGLQRFYGIDDAKGLAYFHVHREADREHAAVERTMLTGLVNPMNADAVMTGAELVLNALNGFLSAAGALSNRG